MKGTILKILETTATEHFGDEARDKTLETAELAGAYTSLGNYDDAEVVALLNKPPSSTGEMLGERLRWFGCHSTPSLQNSLPQFCESHDQLGFLPTLNQATHSEAHKLHLAACPPVFELDEEKNVYLTEPCERKRCYLAEGLSLGTADTMKEDIAARLNTCMLHGDDHCNIELSWS